MSGYSLRLYSPAGASIGEITQCTGIDLAYGQTTPGVCYVTTAAKVTSAMHLAPLSMLEIYRQVEGIWYNEGERIWWLMDATDFVTADGLRGQQYTFYDANAMLQGRYVLYQAGSANADMTGAADNLLKAIVNTNCGTGADAARQWGGLSIQADLTACASISKAFAWRPVLAVMQEICNQASAGGNYLSWDFVRTGIGTQEMRTYNAQRGANRGSTSGQILRLTAESGSLESPKLSFSRHGYPNHITAGGRGEETARSLQTVTDAQTPLGMLRFESFIDRRNTDNDTDLLSEANAQYQASRPRSMFDGSLGQTPSMRYGYDVNYGDKVNVEYAGYAFDCHIRAVHIAIDGDGNEALEVRLRNYE